MIRVKYQQTFADFVSFINRFHLYLGDYTELECPWYKEENGREQDEFMSKYLPDAQIKNKQTPKKVINT